MHKKITQDEFLHRIRTSESSTQEAFTNEALIALYEFYDECPKFFNVASMLRQWQEFATVEAAERYCDIAIEHIMDMIIKFDTGLLVWIDEVEQLTEEIR